MLTTIKIKGKIMKKLTKSQTKEAIKKLASSLNYLSLRDNCRYLATSNLGEIQISFDLNDPVPTIFSKISEFSRAIPNTEASQQLQIERVERRFSEHSMKRNYHCFPDSVDEMIEDFLYDVILDEIKIINCIGER